MHRRSWLVVVVIAVVALALAVALSVSGNTPDSEAGETTTTVEPTVGPSTPQPSTTTTTVTSTTTETVPPGVTLAPGESVCDRYRSVEVAGTVESVDLVETSGIAASRTAPGVVWAHNDSGDDPIIYAIGPSGEDLGAFSLEGGLAFDWEDLSVGPGPDGSRSYLYVGDIGDNFLIRDGRFAVYRIEEPDPAALDEAVAVETAFVVDAPDGAHDLEALFVADGSIYVVTKDEQPTRVYRAAETGDGRLTLELAATIELGASVTAADVSWDGSTIAFRGYSDLWLWHRAPGTTVADALSAEPCTAPSPDEIQGEAVTFLGDGTLVTVSEGPAPNLHLLPPTG